MIRVVIQRLFQHSESISVMFSREYSTCLDSSFAAVISKSSDQPPASSRNSASSRRVIQTSTAAHRARLSTSPSNTPLSR